MENIIKRGKLSTTPLTINVDGVEVNDPMNISESFSDHFSNIARTFAAQSSTDTSPDFYKLQEFVRKRLPQETHFHLPPISEEFVAAQFLHLKKDDLYVSTSTPMTRHNMLLVIIYNKCKIN